jgi:hypothetical protein
MIINEILAIAWFVICSFWISNLSRRNLPAFLNALPESVRALFRNLIAAFFVLALIGFAASVLLATGATWARWLIGLVALVHALEGVSGFIVPRVIPMTSFHKITAIVSVITIALLLLRR